MIKINEIEQILMTILISLETKLQPVSMITVRLGIFLALKYSRHIVVIAFD